MHTVISSSSSHGDERPALFRVTLSRMDGRPSTVAARATAQPYTVHARPRGTTTTTRFIKSVSAERTCTVLYYNSSWNMRRPHSTGWRGVGGGPLTRPGVVEANVRRPIIYLLPFGVVYTARAHDTAKSLRRRLIVKKTIR